MNYGYSLKGKVVSVVLMLLFVVLAVLATETVYRLGAGLAALFLLKDVLSVFTTEYYVTEAGLQKKDIFGDESVCNWQTLEFITVTKKNKEWVALVSSDSIKYLKKHIVNKRELLIEVVSHARKNKNLAVHDHINVKYQMKLRLNEEGKIRS